MAGVPAWRCAPFRTRRSPRRCAIAADAHAQSGNTKCRSGGSRGLRRMACSTSGITSSIDPVRTCTRRDARNALTKLRSNASAVSYSGMASSYRPLRAQHLAFDVMRKRAAGRCRQSLLDQPFRTCDVGRGRVAHIIKHAGASTFANQLCASTDRWIERQCALEQADRLRTL